VYRLTKLYKICLPFIFPLVGLTIACVIYFQLSERLSAIDFNKLEVSSINLFFILISIILMLVNWSLEAYKWGALVDRFQSLSFSKKLISVLMGLSIGFLTPNRIGDYAGRLRFISPSNRMQSIHASFVASVYQTAVTLLVGGVGLAYWLDQEILSTHQVSLIYLILLIVSLGFVLLLFRMKWMISQIIALRFLSYYADRFSWFLSIERKVLQRVFFLALLRYCVFMLQYYLIIIAFPIESSFILVISSISIIYLITTIVPTSTISDIILRGAISLVILGTFIASEEIILAITALVWCINLVLPSLIGTSLIIFNRDK